MAKEVVDGEAGRDQRPEIRGIRSLESYSRGKLSPAEPRQPCCLELGRRKVCDLPRISTQHLYHPLFTAHTTQHGSQGGEGLLRPCQTQLRSIC